MKPPQQEASLVDRLRDHQTAMRWLARSILDDSDSDMEVQGARAAVVTNGVILARKAIAALDAQPVGLDVERLAEALRKYGCHLRLCATGEPWAATYDPHCTCGLSAALASEPQP